MEIEHFIDYQLHSYYNKKQPYDVFFSIKMEGLKLRKRINVRIVANKTN